MGTASGMRAAMMGAACISETSVYFNETTRRYIRKGYYLHSISGRWSQTYPRNYLVFATELEG
jgi:hypothetical protein